MTKDNKKLRRFISGIYSVNDYQDVKSYFILNKYDKWLKAELENEWNNTEGTRDVDARLTPLLNKLHHTINLNSSKKNSKFRSWYYNIAASLLIPALIIIGALAYLTINSSDQKEAWVEIHSPIGSRTKFQLPDGSYGWMNSGSFIKYPIDFSDRVVEVSGEAWFDVVHMKTKDFKVITPYFDVRVLGTQFNVVAYDTEDIAEVILEEGKVDIRGRQVNFESLLEPDQSLVFNKKSSKILKRSIDSKSYTTWKDGILTFRNVPMTEIARRLERKYYSEIILHGDSLKSSVFRATFKDESLDEICKMLSSVAPIDYKIHKREKLPDETFTKSKVEMWLRK